MQTGKASAPAERYDVVVVGGGFGGLYSLYRLLRQGRSVVAFEAGDDVGGTWYWNTYPGARCDLESIEYSFSFDHALEQEWDWPERYSGADDIQRYARHVAERFDLLRHIRLGTRVTSARFDEALARWTIETDRGETVFARYCIMATGMLSTPVLPDLPGLGDFGGRILHTGAWPRGGVDLSGTTVGVFGTGSSGIQLIPEIAKEAAKVVVFQRTPAYAVPSRNRPLGAVEAQEVKSRYPAFRHDCLHSHGAIFRPDTVTDRSALEFAAEERDAIYERAWERGGVHFVTLFNDLNVDAAASDTAADFIRRKIRSIVRNPATAAALCPQYPVGARRICLEDGYYEAFNRPNVELVDLRTTPLVSITATGVATTAGTYDVDSLVCATGFDAMTGTLARIDIVGRDDVQLRDAWADGPLTFLGMAVAGFPNLFLIEGPLSPGATANAMRQIEVNVEWITDCIGHLESNGFAFLEATQEAQNMWRNEVNALVARTLYMTTESWYWGANIAGKPRVFMSYLNWPLYLEHCRAAAADGYRAFRLGRSTDGAVLTAGSDSTS